MTPTPNRGYFQGPEGKVNVATWGFLALGLLVVVYLMGGKIGDYLVSAADNTLHLAIVGGIICLIGAALLDPKKRIWYVFRSLIRMLTSWFIELDPIGIRKSYCERVQAKYQKFTDAVATLRGQLIAAQRKAAINEKDLAEQNALFQSAVKRSDQRQEVLLSKQIKRDEILRDQYNASIASLSKFQKVVVRYQEICADTVTDLQADIKFRQEQQALTQATRGISGSIRAILQGLPEKDMYDEAGDVLDSQYDQTLGEFDNVLDLTKDILSNADMRDDAALQAALAKFETKDTGVMVGKQTKAEVLKQITAGPESVTPPQPAGDYSDLLR